MKKLFLALLVLSSASSFATEYEAEKKVDKFMKMGYQDFMGGQVMGFSSCQTPANLVLSLRQKRNEEGLNFIFGTNRKYKYKNIEPIFPVEGKVEYEITNEDGNLTEFEDQYGDVITFGADKNAFYMVESDKSWEKRFNIRPVDCAGVEALGSFIAEVYSFDLFHLKVQFHFIVPNDESAEKEGRPAFRAVDSGVMEIKLRHGNLHRLQGPLRGQSRGTINRNPQYRHHWHHWRGWRGWHRY